MTLSVAAPLAVQPVGRRTLLLVWESEPAPRSAQMSVRIAGTGVAAPHALVRLPLQAGGVRNVLAVRAGVRAGSMPIDITSREGGLVARLVCEAEAWQPAGGFDAPLLAGGLAGRERGRLLRFLAEVCGSLFHLQQDHAFGAALRALLAETVAAAGRLVARCRLPSGLVLCEALVPEGLGEQLSAVALGSDRVMRLAARPGYLACRRTRPGRATVALILPAAAAAAETVLIFGEGGVARRVPAGFSATLPFVHAWLANPAAARTEDRRFLLDRLSDGSLGGRPGEALCRELQVLAARAGSNGRGVEAAADLVLASESGVLIVGSLSDAHGLVDQIEVERRGVSRVVPPGGLVRFGRGQGAAGGEGFILRITGGGPAMAPVSLALRLGSGARLPFGEGPAALSPADAQDALLAAVAGEPPAARVVSAIAPAVRDLVNARRRAAGVCEVVDIGRGPTHPRVSVLVPFCRDAELLRCRMGVLAADPTLARAEFLHLLESAGDTPFAVQMLTELHAGYGVPSRLVTFAGNPPFGGMIDLAARLAGGSLIALLGRNAVPEAPGWLAELARHLEATPRCGIVGAQVINPDHSLLCAGYAIAPGTADGAGWALQPLLRGFPRDYPAAAEAGRVASLPAECLLLGRALARELSATADGLLLPESVIAAMCLGAGARGLDVWRLPTPAVVTWRRDGGGKKPDAQHALIAELDRDQLAHLHATLAAAGPVAERLTTTPAPCALLPRRKVA